MKHCLFANQRFTRAHLLAVFATLSVVSVFISCAGGARSVAASGLGKASDPVPFMEKAKTGTLPSGLRYYLLENAKPEGRAFLTLAVNAGSVLETEDERGLAHFVEHMAFSGTARFPGSELIDYLRSLGMRFGPEANAYTSFDETVYGIEVPVETGPGGGKRIPETALEVIDDWTWGVSFDPQAVEKERPIIMEEYRSRLGAQERISRAMYPLLFRGSPYAARLPIGVPETIENAPPERLEGFYKKWYRPENMAVIIVGDFDAAFLESALADRFPAHERAGAAETGAAFARPRYNLSEPEKGGVRALIQTDKELSRSRVDLYWKRTAEPRRDDLAYYREGAIDYLAGTALSLRFEEAAAKSETPYVYAGGGHAAYGYSSRYYILAAQAKTGLAKDTLNELLLVKESLSRYGFTQDETDGAKAALLSYMEQIVSESDRQPSDYYVDAFTRHFLDGDTVPDAEWELEALKKLLPGITLKEINNAVKGYFEDDDLTVFISAPEAEQGSLPEEAGVAALAAEARRAKIEAPAVAAAAGGLLDEIPSPGTIAAETVDNETGAVRWKLGNGAEVILKDTQNQNSEVSFYALARGGSFSAPAEDAVSATLAAEMANASGLGSHSRSELARILLDKQAAASFWTQGYLRGFQGSAAAKDAKTLFEMIRLGFVQPRFDAGAIDAMIDQRRSGMAFEENSPDAVFRKEIARTSYGNPRFHPLELADLDNASPAAARAFVRACLNPGDYVFAFVGNIDFAQFRSLTETYLASIPPAPAFNEWADLDPQRPPDTEKEIRMGLEARSAVYMGWFSPRPYSEEKSAAVSVLSEYLDIRLTDEIREKLGGVYSIAPWVSLNPIPRGELSGGVYFFCDPKRAEELGEAVKAEFRKAAEGDIDLNDFAKAAEALIQGHEQTVQSNLYIAQSYANSAAIYRSPLSRLDKRPGLYRAASPGDIAQAAAELLEGSLVRLVLYPETPR